MTWILIRTTGFVAYAFLSGAAIWGLLVSTGILGRGASPKRLTNVHESLSMAAILATIGHLVFLYFDEFVQFNVAQLMVPGQSDWKPRAVSLGIVSFYGLMIITASFYFRAKIGQKRWRTLHFASFGVWVAALAHGIMAGTDTSTVVGVTVYSSTATAIAFLTFIRGYLVANPAKATRASRPARAPNPPVSPTVDDALSAVPAEQLDSARDRENRPNGDDPFAPTARPRHERAPRHPSRAPSN